MPTDNTPMLNTTITFCTSPSPFTALSILSENKAQTAAKIMSNTEKISIVPLHKSQFTKSSITRRQYHIKFSLALPNSALLPLSDRNTIIMGNKKGAHQNGKTTVYDDDRKKQDLQ